MAGEDGVDTTTLGTVAIVGAILTAVLIIVLQGLYQRLAHEEAQNKIVVHAGVVAQRALAAQQGELSAFSWIDREQGRVRIPLELAKKKIAGRLSAAQHEAQQRRMDEREAVP